MISRLNTIPVDGGQPPGRARARRSSTSRTSPASPRARTSTSTRLRTRRSAPSTSTPRSINDDADQVVTSSWGLCEQAVQQGEPGVQQAENLVFQQAAAQGQTVFSAAGDEGSNDCNAFRTTSPVRPDPVGRRPVEPALRRRPSAARRSTTPPSPPPSTSGTTARLGRGRRRHLRVVADAELAARLAGAGRRDPSAATQRTPSRSADLGYPGTGSARPTTRRAPSRPVPPAARRQRPGRRIHRRGDDLHRSSSGSAGPRSAAPRRRRRSGRPCWRTPTPRRPARTIRRRRRRRRLRQPAALRGGVESDRLRGLLQRHHDGQQRPVRRLPVAGLRCSAPRPATTWPRASASPQLTQPGRRGLAFYLCNQAPAATRPTVRTVPGLGFTSAPEHDVTITGTHFQDARTRSSASRSVATRCRVRLQRHGPDHITATSRRPTT